VLDALLHRFGLHGYSSIPIMLGLGCKVPAFLATRVLVNRREKVLTAALILMSAPCLPQSAMIFSLGVHYGAGVVFTVFAAVLCIGLAANFILNRLMPGQTSELFMEIPPYRLPMPGLLARKLWIRIVEYAREVLPMIAAGVFIIHLLDMFKVIEFISGVLSRPLALVLGLPNDIAPVLILGFLRKDVSIALLAPFHLSGAQFVIACIFMVLYAPCIASSFTLVKEMGVSAGLKVIGVSFLAAVFVAALLHGIFTAMHLAGI
jgi:ferrous iron transport protein B